MEKSLQGRKIRHLRLAEPTCTPPNSTLSQTIERMRKDRAACALICEAGRLLGIFTERDVLRKVIGESIDLEQPVERLMTAHPESLSPDDSILAAIDLMTRGGYRHVPLTDPNGKLVGMVSAHDIVDYIAEHFPTEVANLPPRLHQRPRAPEGA